MWILEQSKNAGREIRSAVAQFFQAMKSWLTICHGNSTPILLTTLSLIFLSVSMRAMVITSAILTIAEVAQQSYVAARYYLLKTLLLVIASEYINAFSTISIGAHKIQVYYAATKSRIFQCKISNNQNEGDDRHDMPSIEATDGLIRIFHVVSSYLFSLLFFLFTYEWSPSNNWAGGLLLLIVLCGSSVLLSASVITKIFENNGKVLASEKKMGRWIKNPYILIIKTFITKWTICSAPTFILYSFYFLIGLLWTIDKSTPQPEQMPSLAFPIAAITLNQMLKFSSSLTSVIAEHFEKCIDALSIQSNKPKINKSTLLQKFSYIEVPISQSFSSNLTRICAESSTAFLCCDKMSTDDILHSLSQNNTSVKISLDGVKKSLVLKKYIAVITPYATLLQDTIKNNLEIRGSVNNYIASSRLAKIDSAICKISKDGYTANITDCQHLFSRPEFCMRFSLAQAITSGLPIFLIDDTYLPPPDDRLHSEMKAIAMLSIRTAKELRLTPILFTYDPGLAAICDYIHVVKDNKTVESGTAELLCRKTGSLLNTLLSYNTANTLGGWRKFII